MARKINFITFASEMQSVFFSVIHVVKAATKKTKQKWREDLRKKCISRMSSNRTGRTGVWDVGQT